MFYLRYLGFVIFCLSNIELNWNTGMAQFNSCKINFNLDLNYSLYFLELEKDKKWNWAWVFASEVSQDTLT